MSKINESNDVTNILKNSASKNREPGGLILPPGQEKPKQLMFNIVLVSLNDPQNPVYVKMTTVPTSFIGVKNKDTGFMFSHVEVTNSEIYFIYKEAPNTMCNLDIPEKESKQ